MKGETMVSDQEIARGVEILLRQSQSESQNDAVSALSLNGVVQTLGAKLGADLSHKAGFIRDQINLLKGPFCPPPPPQQPSEIDHFALRRHPQFLQQPQQQQQFPPQQFAFHFGGVGGRELYGAHAPPQGFHAPPQLYHAPAPQQPQPHPTTAPPPPPPAAPKNAKASKESTQSGAKRRGGAGGLNKLCGISPKLQVIVGEAAMARTEVVKQLWVYIRKHSLQDPSNKRKIFCDEALRAVFETDCTDMFQMNKLLAKHILRLDPATEQDSVPSKRHKVDVESIAETTEGPSPVVISVALALFLGTTRKEMLPSEVNQRVWDYIKANSLEDPSSVTVICDAKLKELFGCESIPVVGMNEMLARYHLFQSS